MDSNTFDRIYFNTDALPERDRFPAVREEFARRLLTIDAVNRSAEPFCAKFDIHLVGRFAVAYIETSPADYVRTPELIRDGQEFLFATLNFKSTMFLSQPASGGSINPGEAALLDSTHIGGIHFDTSASHLTMRIARSEITRLVPPGVHLAGAALNKDPLACRLLFSYLGGTRDLDMSSGGPAAQLYDEHILDLVVLALGAQGDARRLAEERGARAARRSAILREIDRRSGDPELNANALAHVLGITPRYVHLLLEETGHSFTHHVLEKRLERATALLRDPQWHDRKIADIAVEAGFTDLSYFNRTFRRNFGATPTELREASWKQRK
jgi:AraC-like DNA-binding protein